MQRIWRCRICAIQRLLPCAVDWQLRTAAVAAAALPWRTLKCCLHTCIYTACSDVYGVYSGVFSAVDAGIAASAAAGDAVAGGGLERAAALQPPRLRVLQ